MEFSNQYVIMILGIKKCSENGKALVDISRTDLILKEEIKHTSDIVQALDIVGPSVMTLENRDCDLIKSEKIILLLLQNLREQNTNISLNLFTAISKRTN